MLLSAAAAAPTLRLNVKPSERATSEVTERKKLVHWHKSKIQDRLRSYIHHDRVTHPKKRGNELIQYQFMGWFRITGMCNASMCTFVAYIFVFFTVVKPLSDSGRFIHRSANGRKSRLWRFLSRLSGDKTVCFLKEPCGRLRPSFVFPCWHCHCQH